MITASTTLFVIGALLLDWATVAVFFPKMLAVIPAFVGMTVLWLGDCIVLPSSNIIFWGVATVLVVINHFLLPRGLRSSRAGLGYFAGGTLAGLAVGLTVYSKASLIGGACLGAFLGALAFSQTAAGRPMNFPSSKFFNYLGAKGIPLVVALSMVGISLAAIIAGKVVFG